MYWFFSTATKLKAKSSPRFDDILLDAGLCKVESAAERFGLIRTTVWIKPIRE